VERAQFVEIARRFNAQLLTERVMLRSGKFRTEFGGGLRGGSITSEGIIVIEDVSIFKKENK